MPVATCWYACIAIPAGIADAGRQSRRVRAQIAGRTLAVDPITSGVPVETTAVANDAFAGWQRAKKETLGTVPAGTVPFSRKKCKKAA